MGLHKGIGILLFTVGHYKTYGKCLTKNTLLIKHAFHLFEHQPVSKLFIFLGIGATAARSKNQPTNLITIPFDKAAQGWNKLAHPNWPTQNYGIELPNMALEWPNTKMDVH